MKNNVREDEFLRKRAIRQKKIRKRRLKIFFTFLVISLLITTVALCLTVFFPIEKINFTGSKMYSESQLSEASDIEKGDNLFTVPKSKVEQRLKKKLPFVDKIEINRRLPDTLNVKVFDAEEYACYFVDNKYYVVSESGWILKTVPEQPTNVYTVIGSKAKCKVGTEIEFADEKLEALSDEITKVLGDTKISVDSIDISDSLSIILQVESRFEVKLGTSNYMAEKIRHLAGMIKEIDPSKSGNIDLSMWTNDNSRGTFTPIIRQ